MKKDISTLVADIQEVILGKGGWDEVVNEHFRKLAGDSTKRRFSDPPQERSTLRMSNLGSPCKRKLWYTVNSKGGGEELSPSTHFKFLFGDLLEDLLICLAIAAGHEVTGEQGTLSILGIKGHRDCVIDGVTVDVKSASSFSFDKFKSNGLRGYNQTRYGKNTWVPAEKADSFGYISQLSSYVYAAKDDPLVRDKTHGAFLVVDKQHGHICLDMYDLSKELKTKESEVQKLKEAVAKSEPPKRPFKDEAEGKSGNRKLCLQCSYCGYKNECWPELRTFIYANKPVFLTKTVKVPNVSEAT